MQAIQGHIRPEFIGLLFSLISGCSTAEGIIFTQGKEQLNQQQYAQAYDSFTRYLALEPKSPKGYYNRALASLGLENLSDAVSDLDQVVNLRPRDAEARRMRFGLNAELLDFARHDTVSPPAQRPVKDGYESALAVIMLNDLDAILSIDSYDTWALNERGRLKHELKDFDGALADYDAALMLCDTCTWLMFNKALTLRACWRTREALDVLTTLIDADSLDGDAWLLLGECNFGLGRRREACRAFARAMALGVAEAEERYNTLCR